MLPDGIRNRIEIGEVLRVPFSGETDGAGPLLEAVRLFDVYTGAQVSSGQKSLAYKLTFRAPDRTLTAEEAVAARDSAVAAASSRLGATLRGA